jgi:prepilin-type N-terminal cleavage/methylation domain-containing protein
MPDIQDGNSKGAPNAPAPETPRHMQGRDGLTLVEMMIASGLLAILLGGLFDGFIMAQRSSYLASDAMGTVHTARKAMETLANCSYGDTLLNVGSNKTLSTLGMSNLYSVAMNPTYPSTKDVTMTVYWKRIKTTNVYSLTYSCSFTQCLH